eukprot:956557-Pelagomonas_calceolata.AAC.1
MELLLLCCQCVRSQPLQSMSGRVLAQHTRALPGDTAWRRLTSPPNNKLNNERDAHQQALLSDTMKPLVSV